MAADASLALKAGHFPGECVRLILVASHDDVHFQPSHKRPLLSHLRQRQRILRVCLRRTLSLLLSRCLQTPRIPVFSQADLALLTRIYGQLHVSFLSSSGISSDRKHTARLLSGTFTVGPFLTYANKIG